MSSHFESAANISAGTTVIAGSSIAFINANAPAITIAIMLITGVATIAFYAATMYLKIKDRRREKEIIYIVNKIRLNKSITNKDKKELVEKITTLR